MAATSKLIQTLLEGLEMNGPVYLVDLLPNRYGEWSRAAWSLQKEHLQTGNGPDLRYVGYFGADGNEAEEWQKFMAGEIRTDACHDCVSSGRPRLGTLGCEPGCRSSKQTQGKVQ